MIIIGEKINSSVKTVKEAIENKNYDFLIDLAKKQEASGANYIDINSGVFIENEAEVMKTLIELIQDSVSVPLSLDSSNPDVIVEAVKVYNKSTALYNSIIFDKYVLDKAIPVIKEYNMSVIALLMENNQIPEDSSERIEIAKRLVEYLNKNGIDNSRIFLDPMVQPLSIDQRYINVSLETIKLIKQTFSDINIICGLSNVSYGLPNRKWINRSFVSLAIYFGLNSAILDPLDKTLLNLIYASEALNGTDEYCMEYILKAREGSLD
ncbi:dihydropteroate synthase [Caldicellulosiruptoraceae bacterium PP1]